MFDMILGQWPKPPANPTEALLHTLDTYIDRPDDDLAITATTSVYGDMVRTGLTWGDLRAIAARIKQSGPEGNA